MAKGQMRRNREVRKPKKDKVAAAAPQLEGSQVKLAGNAALAAGKKK